jgi:hypothetical protein
MRFNTNLIYQLTSAGTIIDNLEVNKTKYMASSDKLAEVSVNVPFHAPGNVIINKEMNFEVYKINGQYKAVPICSYQDRMLASLPPELVFNYTEGMAVSNRGNLKDGNIEVINDIVQELKKQKALQE